MVLMRTDPFRDLDRFAQQILGTAARPAVMPMDAWRDGDQFIVEFDLPGVKADSLDLDVERNVLTVRAARSDGDQTPESDKTEPNSHDGVLRLTIPMAEKAKPRRIEISHDGQQTAINA